MADAKGKRGDKRAVHDLAPIFRRSFVRALARIANGEDNEAALATLIEKSLEKDFVATINAMSKFNPRESNIKGQVTGLADVLRELNERDANAAGAGKQDRPVESPASDVRH